MQVKSVDNMKKTILKLIGSSFIPFVILVLIFIIIHTNISCDFGDDIIKKAGYLQNSLWDVMAYDYYNWDSPGLLSIVMYYLVLLPPFVFKIINIMVILLAAYSISFIANHTNNIKVNWIITIFIILYPFNQMSTAGWIVTSVAYMFPLAFGLYSLTPIKRILTQKKIPYAQAVIALLFAVTSPQMTSLLFGIYILFSIYFVYKKTRSIFSLLMCLICSSFFIYHVITPGNHVRYIKEILNWFPDYNMISFVDKIKMGFTSTLANFVVTPNIFFLSFCILLLGGVWLKHKDIFFRIISTIPLTATFVFGVFSYLNYSPTSMGLIDIKKRDFINVTIYNFTEMINYLPIILGFIIVGCILLSFYLIFGNSMMALLVNIIFISGFASRMILSFSPTLYASSTRTFIYMYFAIIVCGVFVFSEIIKYMSKGSQTIILTIFGFAGLVNLVKLLLTLL